MRIPIIAINMKNPVLTEPLARLSDNSNGKSILQTDKLVKIYSKKKVVN